MTTQTIRLNSSNFRETASKARGVNLVVRIRGCLNFALRLTLLSIAIPGPGCGELSAQPARPANFGTVSGRIVSLTGIKPTAGREPNPIPNVRVTLTDASTGQTIATTLSDSYGAFQFAAPPGTYSVSGADARQMVRIDAGKHHDLLLTSPSP